MMSGINWSFGIGFAILLFVAGCASQPDLGANSVMAEAHRISKETIACRNAIGAKPAYRGLSRRMPLVEPFNATLAQVSDSAMANDEEIEALKSWFDDTRQCRRQVLEEAFEGLPTATGLLLSAWNKDDEVFAKLIEHRLSWGDALMRIRRNRAEALIALVNQSIEIAKQARQERDAATARRVQIFGALNSLVP